MSKENVIKIKKITVGIFSVNCYIIYNSESKNAAIIDPGDEIDVIKNFIENEGLNVKIVLNTHGHIDHAGKVSDFLNIYKVKYLIHNEDLFWLDKLPEQASLFGLEFSAIAKPSGFLNDGEELDCSLDCHIKVIHTPGHTPGSTSFLVNNHLFTGDTLFQGSIGRTDFPKSSYSQLMYSIKRKLFLLPPETVVHPGHGNDTTIGVEKETNPFLI